MSLKALNFEMSSITLAKKQNNIKKLKNNLYEYKKIIRMKCFVLFLNATFKQEIPKLQAFK